MHRKKILESCIFITFLLMSSYGLGVVYTKKIMAESVFPTRDKQFRDSPYFIKNLILGDSHTVYNLNPELIDDSFNAALAGGNFVMLYYKLKNILDSDIKKLDTIILQFELNSFEPHYLTRAPYSREWYWAQFVDFAQVGKISGHRAYFQWVHFKSIFAPYIGRKEEFFHIMKPDAKARKMVKGHVPIHKPYPGDERMAKEAARTISFHFLDRHVIDKALLSYLYKILELCKENNLRVILIRNPLTTQYYQKALQIASFEDNDKIRQEILDRYANVKYLDFLNLYFDNKEYFFDPDHLNANGADEFSKLVAQQLRLLQSPVQPQKAPLRQQVYDNSKINDQGKSPELRENNRDYGP